MKSIFILLAILSFTVISCDSGLKFENPNDPNNTISQSGTSCTHDGAFNCKENAVLKCENNTWQKIEQCEEKQKCNSVKGICETVGESGDTTSEADTDDPDTDDPDTTPDSGNSQPDTDQDNDPVTTDNDTNTTPDNPDADDSDTEPTEESTIEPTDEPTDIVTPCIPYCDGKKCGSDGCGGTCGTCEFNQICSTDQTSCIIPPECSRLSGTPCHDSTNDLIWSNKAQSSMDWFSAVFYCEKLSDGGLKGWHLPTIDELRTLIQNCSNTETGGSCNKEGCLDNADDDTCWNNCGGCSSDSSGNHSKLGDIGSFWSKSSFYNNGEPAFFVNFLNGGLGYYSKTNDTSDIRCVRHDFTDNPCDPNPCKSVVNSTNECSTIGTTYSCGCKTGSEWNGSECVVDAENLTECSPTSAIPCIDTANNLIWSSATSISMFWQYAIDYCHNYSVSGLSGWRLPTISELRTLVQNCPATEMPNGTCGIREDETVCLSYNDCRDNSCDGCYSNDEYSKLGDTVGYFWSSSISSGGGATWALNFYHGEVALLTNEIHPDGFAKVRCVRN